MPALFPLGRPPSAPFRGERIGGQLRKVTMVAGTCIRSRRHRY